MEDIELLTSLANGMAPGKTICALSDAAAIPTHSLVRHFRSELVAHVEGRGCPFASRAHPPLLAEAHA
jgi:NADH-quinone oxidoreductase subunit F